MPHGGFHRLGALQHFSDDQLVIVEQAAHLIHAGHKWDIANTENGFALWEGLLDEAHAFDGLLSRADVVLITSPKRKHQRVKNQIFGGKSIFLGQEFVTALRYLQFSFGGDGHALDWVVV